jgi:translation initiation factor IF-2
MRIQRKLFAVKDFVGLSQDQADMLQLLRHEEAVKLAAHRQQMSNQTGETVRKFEKSGLGESSKEMALKGMRKDYNNYQGEMHKRLEQDMKDIKTQLKPESKFTPLTNTQAGTASTKPLAGSGEIHKGGTVEVVQKKPPVNNPPATTGAAPQSAATTTVTNPQPSTLGAGETASTPAKPVTETAPTTTTTQQNQGGKKGKGNKPQGQGGGKPGNTGTGTTTQQKPQGGNGGGNKPGSGKPGNGKPGTGGKPGGGKAPVNTGTTTTAAENAAKKGSGMMGWIKNNKKLAIGIGAAGLATAGVAAYSHYKNRQPQQ